MFVRYASRSRYFIDDLVVGYDCRITYVLEGEGEVYVGNKRYSLKPYTFFYYSAGDKYHIRSEKGMEFFTINFDFTDDYKNIQTQRPVSAFDADITKILRTQNLAFDDVFKNSFVIYDAMSLKNDLEALVLEHESSLLLKDNFCSAYLNLILCRAVRLIKNTLPEDTVFKKTLWYIKENYKEHLDNDVIAKAINYHPNYINSVIRNKTGMSLHKYITNFRISKATELLCNTTLSVQEVSEHCGFVNSNHFSASFKKNTGTSPLNLRKGNKKEAVN